MPDRPQDYVNVVGPWAEFPLAPRHLTVAIWGLSDGPTILGKTAVVAVGVWCEFELPFESDDPLVPGNCHLRATSAESIVLHKFPETSETSGARAFQYRHEGVQFARGFQATVLGRLSKLLSLVKGISRNRGEGG